MSARPPQGLYVIYNRVLSPAGQKLALTCNGEGNPLTVTPYAQSPDQIWHIKNFVDGRTQYVIPNDESTRHLEVCFHSNGNITVRPGGAYVWTIRPVKDGYTIQDGGVTVFWGLEEGADGEKVIAGEETSGQSQRWVLERLE